MENVSFDDIGLLLGVIEIRMILHILVNELLFPVLQCDIFTYSVSILIHSPYAYLKCEISLVLTWSHSMYYNCSILYLASCAAWFVHRLWSAPVRLYLLLVRLDLFTALCHNALVTTHVCSIMVFVSSVDVTFSWLVSTLFCYELLWWSTFFLLWMASGCSLWSLMIILALVAFVPRSYSFWLALLFEWHMLVLWGV
jgi:hypothetical protein